MAQAATVTPPAPHKIQLPPRPLTLGARKLNRADLAHPVLFATVANNVLYDDVMKPAFWANNVDAFKSLPFGEVTIIREDGSMILKLIALGVMPGGVRMHCWYAHEDNSNLRAGTASAETELEALEPPPGYKYAHAIGGPVRGHLVRLAENGEVVVSGVPSKAAAIAQAWKLYNAANAGGSGERPRQAGDEPPANTGGAPAQT
jgi:hypothetical protein